ncbi:MAG: glycosyltransferase family 4 protein [Ktedonobacteraceae bacterium]
MKIAQIAPPWIRIPPKNYGGTETVIANLVEEQVAEGHEVTLLAPGDASTSAHLVSFFPQSLIDAGVPWQGHLKAYYHLHKSIEYIQAHKFDIVHMHLSSSSDMYLFPLSSALKTPHIVTMHSRFPFDRVQSWTGDADELFKDWFLSAPMVAISKNARDDAPYALNFVGVVHHGLPMNFFKNTVKKPDDCFVWLGRFMPEKGAHLAIQAVKHVGGTLVLAGIIDKYIAESVTYFEEQIKPHIDGQQIKYVGPVNTRQKISLLSKARGFLNPIQWEEPFGMVMIEAMAVGCPVISFARGAAPEIVAQGKSGFLVDSLEEMIERIPHLAEFDRFAVRDYVLQNFSVKAMAEQYNHVYEKVIASTKFVSKRGTGRTKSNVVAQSSFVPAAPSNA